MYSMCLISDKLLTSVTEQLQFVNVQLAGYTMALFSSYKNSK